MKSLLLRLNKKCGLDESSPYKKEGGFDKSNPYNGKGGLINQTPTIYLIG